MLSLLERLPADDPRRPQFEARIEAYPTKIRLDTMTLLDDELGDLDDQR